jgi:hypothetical protein
MTRLTEGDLLNEVIQIFVVLSSVFFFMAQSISAVLIATEPFRPGESQHLFRLRLSFRPPERRNWVPPILAARVSAHPQH